ncbi:hypothetical protein BLOT_007804 [Blomia tropicalis]|nr:hypothetical protein BLOT_007804 [Blomia tropicalis]
MQGHKTDKIASYYRFCYLFTLYVILCMFIASKLRTTTTTIIYMIYVGAFIVAVTSNGKKATPFLLTQYEFQ